MPTVTETIDATVAQLQADSATLRAIVHGPASGPGSVVATQGGNVLTAAAQAAALQGLTGRQILGLADSGGLIPPDLFPPAEGENFIVVATTADPIQNGVNLVEAVARAGVKTPNGLPIGTSGYGNFVEILLPPARYDLNGGSLNLPSGVSLVGLASSYLQCFITSTNVNDGFVLLTLNGYSRLVGVAVNVAGTIVANAATTDTHACALWLKNSQNFIFDSGIYATNSFSTATGQTSVGIYRASIAAGIRYVTMTSWHMEDCVSYWQSGMQFNSRALDITGCKNTINTTFVRCALKITDQQNGSGGRYVDCTYIQFATSSAADCYVAGFYTNCREVAFSEGISGGVSYGKRFVVSGQFRNCSVGSISGVNWSSGPKFFNCPLTQATILGSTVAQVVAAAALTLVNCLVDRLTTGSADYILQPSNTGGSLYLDRCTLYEGYTPSANFTQLSPTLSGNNAIAPTGFRVAFAA